MPDVCLRLPTHPPDPRHSSTSADPGDQHAGVWLQAGLCGTRQRGSLGWRLQANTPAAVKGKGDPPGNPQLALLLRRLGDRTWLPSALADCPARSSAQHWPVVSPLRAVYFPQLCSPDTTRNVGISICPDGSCSHSLVRLPSSAPCSPLPLPAGPGRVGGGKETLGSSREGRG